MNITKDTHVGEIVAQDYRTAAVFSKSNIDFCCHGSTPLEEACKNQGVSLNEILKQLNDVAGQQTNQGTDYKAWPLDLLADYIEKKHHRYVEAKIKEITPYLEKILNVHGDRHPELSEVERLFKESIGEFTMHMKKEELMVFPAIRKMVKAKVDGTDDKPKRSVEGQISTMLHEHDNEGERFKRISELTNHYTPPTDGCNTYRITLAMLKEFEEDLHLHIHLENNILFPKAIELEASLN